MGAYHGLSCAGDGQGHTGSPATPDSQDLRPDLSFLFKMPKSSNTKRSKVRPDSDPEDPWEFSGNIDEANEEQRAALRARLLGENIDDEEIASDVDLNENEDIDFRRTGDSEEEDEEEVGDDDEFMNLVDVLDGKGEIDPGDNEGKNIPTKTDKSYSNGMVRDNQESRSEEDEGEEDEDEEVGSEDDEEESMAFAPSEDEEAPNALQQLQNFVSNLDSSAKKRKAPDGVDNKAEVERNEGRTRKRRFLQEATEAGEENEFHVRSSGKQLFIAEFPEFTCFEGAKLNLDDLLAPLAEQSVTLQSLKKATKVLGPSGSSKLKALSAPLPHRAQERLDREAAYEQTKQEVDKWSETMKRIREVCICIELI